MKRALAFASLVLPLVVIARCSGSDSSSIDASVDGTVGDTSTTDAPSDVGSTDAPSDVVIGDSASDAAVCDAGCKACCRQAHPDGGAIIRHDEMVCGCTNPGDCEAGATCGSNLCADQKESVACIACLDDSDAGDCTQKALAKCAIQPECAALEACLVACGDGG